MNDLDDLDILADIQALDEALALSAKKKSQPCSSSQRSDVSSDIEDPEDNDDYLDYLHANRYIDESLNAYEINTRLITGLTITKKKLTVLLEECEQKIKLLDEKVMKSRSDESSLSSKLAVSQAGMPYFKNKNYFSAPKNYDARMKEARGELFFPSLKKPNRWTRKDREILLSAINNEAIESVLSGEFNKKIDERTKLVLPRNFNEIVGAVGEREFDWHKISVIDFDNKHSPGECRAMWNVYLHPAFRKNEWTSAEDNKLRRCAKEYKYQDWDAITLKLGTNRSAYQCFIRYNTIKKMPSIGRAWTKQEDRQLVKIMNTFGIGDYVPWAEFSNHMRHRTKQQIYIRWTYSKAPHLKKGRFSSTETKTLMNAVRTYGTKFSKIANLVMPHRTSIQLQQRYVTVMSFNLNLWTIQDDLTLINLNMKYRNNWSKIATFFSNKTRTQVRHRYNALLKYTQKGISLEDIPRPSSSIHRKNLLNKKFSFNNTKTTCNRIKQMQCAVNNFEIQLRLYETLCFPLSLRSNNSEEPYDIEQLARDTKKLYNTLSLLNADFNILMGDFMKYVQLSNREKQLFLSLKEHINMLKNNRIQNNELMEKYRMRMFGSEVSESDFFIPPLPLDGYVKIKKIENKNTSIDYNLDTNEKFLVDMPAEFSVASYILSLINIEEEIQFYKFGQFLTSDYHNCDQQNINLYKSIKCIFSFAKRNASNKVSSSSEHDELNGNLKINFKEDYEQLNKKETTSINEDNEEMDMNIILPDRATLLGLKNLLLWKLLYDCQSESQQCELMESFENERSSEQTTTDSQDMQTESPEYQLLRTRLLQLFKFPISLSNTMLQVDGPETIFSIKNIPNQSEKKSSVSKKRKFKDTKSVQLNKKQVRTSRD